MLIPFLALLALVLFLLATFGVPQHPRFSFVPAGFASLTLAAILVRWPLHAGLL